MTESQNQLERAVAAIQASRVLGNPNSRPLMHDEEDCAIFALQAQAHALIEIAETLQGIQGILEAWRRSHRGQR